MTEMIYEDGQLIVCVKPAGVASQDVEGGLPSILREQLGCAGIFPVHRLDQVVGGVMVYAKSARAAAALSEQIRGGSFRKEYLAVVRGKLTVQEAQLHDYLYHDRAKNKTFVVKNERPGAREALLRYRVCAEAADGEKMLSLVHVELTTGRTHQIRCQFAARKHPLLGDGKYGGGDNRCSCALFSCRLRFRHPMSGEELTFCHQQPGGFPWNLFSEVQL